MNLEEAAKNQFLDLNSDQLRDALRTLDAPMSGKMSDERMRAQLCHTFGVDPPAALPPAPPAPPKANGSGGSPFGPKWPLIPPLHTGGKWGGKMYRVVITSRLAEDKTCPLTWENWSINAKLNAEVDLPQPHYNILVNHVTNEVRQKKVEKDDGETYYEKVFTPFRQFNFQTLGVTPGTDHLPGDLREYYVAFAAARGNFSSLTRPQLDRIHSAVFPDMNPEKQQELPDEKVRNQILEFCGIRREVELEDVA
jgi:hypothetical protein